MTHEQIKELMNTLLQTGEFLASGAFRLALRQTFVYGFMDAFFGSILALVGGIGLWKKRGYWEQKYSAEWEDILVGAFIAASVAGIGLLGTSIRFFLNPEWYAVKLLLETVGIGR